MKKLIIRSLTALSIFLPVVALAQSNFDGFYAGLGNGYSWGKDKGSEYKNSGNDFQDVTQKTTPQGFLFSVLAGTNKVVSENILLGAEIDYDIRNSSDKNEQLYRGATLGVYPVETKVRNGGSLRARMGYIFNNDKTLSYITTGIARIKIERSYSYDEVHQQLSGSQKHNGFVMGFGMEHFLNDTISLRGEYRYVGYITKNIDTSAIYDAGTLEKQRYRDQAIRLGIAYHF